MEQMKDAALKIIKEKLRCKGKEPFLDLGFLKEVNKNRNKTYKFIFEQIVYQRLNCGYNDGQIFRDFEWLKDYTDDYIKTKLEVKSDYLKLIIDDVPENLHLKATDADAEDIYKKWVYAVYSKLFEYKKNNVNKEYINGFISIKSFIKTNCDPDNIFYKPLLDGIVQSGLIKDKISNNIAYKCACEIDKKYQRIETILYFDDNIPAFEKELLF